MVERPAREDAGGTPIRRELEKPTTRASVRRMFRREAVNPKSLAVVTYSYRN